MFLPWHFLFITAKIKNSEGYEPEKGENFH